MCDDNRRIYRKKIIVNCVLISFLSFFMIISLSTSTFAKQGDTSIEGFVGIGRGPDDEEIDFGTEIGGGVGFGYEAIDNFQLQVDISYYKWSESENVGSIVGTEELRNIPLFLGGRLLLPVTPKIKFFGELGLSVNFLKISAKSPGLFSESESKTKIGVVPGIGGYYMVTPQLGLGLGLRYNIIGKGIGDADTVEPSYFSANALISYQF